jgi:hypothetical protein
MGSAAGVMVWMIAHPDTAQGAHDVGSVEEEADTRALPWPTSVAAGERERLSPYLERLVDRAAPGRRDDLQQTLLAAGPKVVPWLLGYLHAVAADDRRAADVDDQLRFLTVDRLLLSIRWDMTPTDLPGPRTKLPDATWIRRRARTWFAGWARAGAALCR